MADTSIVVGIITSASGIIGAAVGGVVTSLLQSKREKQAHTLQMERDRQAHTQQLERDHQADARTIRDEKRSRLRTDYSTILKVALDWQGKVNNRFHYSPKESQEEWMNRLSSYIKDSLNELDQVRVAFILEPDNSNIFGIFHGVWGAYHSYLTSFRANIETPGMFPQTGLSAHEQAMNDKIDELKTVISAKLLELDTAI